MREVIRGCATASVYGLYLRNLLPAYQELESGLHRHRATALLEELARPELYRSDAIISDLHELVGRWDGLPLLREGQVYAQQVAQAASGDGRRLIAHAYTRYLGDLSGGILLRERLANLPGRMGPFRFHEFPGIGNRTAFKAEFRAAIDRAGARKPDWTEVLLEAAEAFQRNIDLSCAVQNAFGANLV